MKKITSNNITHQACQNGNRIFCEILLNRDADVNTRDNEVSKTPLHHRAEGGFREICKLLVIRGASVNACDDSIST